MNTAISTRNFTALIACLLLSSACALPMERLVNEALVTGNWSEVEKREAAAVRRQVREQSLKCERSEVGFCTTKGRLKKRVCTCVSYSDVREALHQPPISDFL